MALLHAGRKFFTSPRRLSAGAPAAMFVNRLELEASLRDALAAKEGRGAQGAAGTLRLVYGFNQGWGVQGGEAIFERAAWMPDTQGDGSAAEW